MTLGVLGGTFDPIHLGHVAAAEAAQRALSLQSILLMPSRIPPHRADAVSANADDRFAMARLAAAGRPDWSASRLELDREGRSFTYDTLVELRDGMDDGSQIFFIIGADAFAEIASWSRYPAVLELAHFVVVSRPGITLDSLRERVPSAFASTPLEADRHDDPSKTRVILVEANTPDISSTDIRRRVRAGESLSGYVPDTIADYIRDHRLYLGPKNAQMAQN
jgi:nicotinate-nucleotide adenylyltransferase